MLKIQGGYLEEGYFVQWSGIVEYFLMSTDIDWGGATYPWVRIRSVTSGSGPNFLLLIEGRD